MVQHPKEPSQHHGSSLYLRLQDESSADVGAHVAALLESHHAPALVCEYSAITCYTLYYIYTTLRTLNEAN